MQVNVYTRPFKTHLFHKASTFLEHSNSVSVVRYIQPNESFKYGLIVSAGMDKTIQCHELMEEQPKFILLGHSANVCCLDVCQESMEIISGSWDNSIIVWSEWQLKCKLVGHDAAVWSVCMFSPNIILSGSADKTIKVWKDYSCIQTIQAHDDCVRCVKVLDAERFVSCSNDSSIKIWNINGSLLQTLTGHSSFVYSLAVLSAAEFVSCGEDRRLLLWRDGSLEQEIIFPTRTLWEVAADGDDVAVASADGKVRIFTRNSSRRCNQEEEDAFNAQVSQFELNQSDVSDNVKIYPQSRLSSAGSDNEVIVVKGNAGSNQVYQWTGDGWAMIGNMMDTAPQKASFEGKEYDFVFDVDMEGTPQKLKLPYNSGENMFTVAMNFIEKNNLDTAFLDEIVSFLKKNVPLSKQTAQFTTIEKINLELVFKKFNHDFDANFGEAEWKSFPFERYINDTGNSSYFTVLDLLRYAVLHDESIFDRLSSFFSQQLFPLQKWKGANLLMIIRLLINMHSSNKGRDVLLENSSALKRFTSGVDVAIPEKYKDTFEILKTNVAMLK